ncbi:hypothetical protein [Rossellomorea sp. NPDC077527]|uniref:hypothetical protein n=1 Tax=Rossellomorea sp. NPDC077527 TaxID=3364510 RepID=UPI0037C637D4
MKKRISPLLKLIVTSTLLVLVVGCNSQNEHVETIETFLKKEFTGPTDELTVAFEEDGAFPPELKEYVEENYKPLVMSWEDMLNANHLLLYQRMAYENGYQLKPANIELKKDQDLAYDYKVKVEYSKDGKTKTATVTGRMNLNDEGKIVTVRNQADGGLLNSLK